MAEALWLISTKKLYKVSYNSLAKPKVKANILNTIIMIIDWVLTAICVNIYNLTYITFMFFFVFKVTE